VHLMAIILSVHGTEISYTLLRTSDVLAPTAYQLYAEPRQRLSGCHNQLPPTEGPTITDRAFRKCGCLSIGQHVAQDVSSSTGAIKWTKTASVVWPQMIWLLTSSRA